MLSERVVNCGTSPTFTGTAPGSYLFKRDLSGSLPSENVMTPDGIRRPVLTALLVEAAVQVDTAASCTINEEDWHTVMRRFTFRDLGGDRYLFSGFKSRLFGQQEFGLAYPPDPASLAPSQANAVRTVNILIPFALPSAERIWDTCVPVDDALNNSCEWRIDSPTASEMLSTGGGAITIDSVAYTIYAYMRLEVDVEVKSRFRCFETDGETNTSDFRLSLNGMVLRSALLCKELGDGGTSVTTVLAQTIPAFRQTNISRNARRVAYGAGMAYRGLTPNTGVAGDSVINDKAYCIQDPIAKITDMPLITNELNVKLSTSLAAPYSFLITAIESHNPTLVDAIAKRYGKTTPSVKTEAKGSNRSFAAWKGRAAFMPLKLT